MVKIDLRSDTVTKPSKAMLEMMIKAPIGDDVFGEDPSVNELQNKAAELLGKESALFVPSGTMANQIALGCFLSPGDQVMGHRDNHIYRWEAGAIARHWGVSYKEIDSKNPSNSLGILDANDFIEHIQPDDPHYPKSRMICLENTLNSGGGRVFPMVNIRSISTFAKNNDLLMHLDGARLLNAAIASNIEAKEYAKYFDTVAICLSKGLGCPVGSLLVGSRDDIDKALRIRKAFGGGMRQAGVIASAGIYALENNINRLKIDHDHAKIFAEAISSSNNFSLSYNVETNMVWFNLHSESPKGADYYVDKMAEKGISLLALGKKMMRAVFHLDITKEQTLYAADVISTL